MGPTPAVSIRAHPWLSTHCRLRRAALLGLSFGVALSFTARAGDILRGGAAAGSRGSGPAAFGSNPNVTAAARNNAKDVLARTTQSVQSVQAMQAAARAAAIAGPNHLGPNPNVPGQILPNVPNGLAPGGLQVLPGVPVNLAAPQPGENAALWTGANLPTQATANGRTVVTVKQNVAQAVLNWRTLNVGKQTTLKFDQSAGGTNQSQWIAFNKITDPSGSPTQILGNIQAEGQVYVINQNGILFGGSSQVNLRSLTASSLPVNDNLVNQGLLNNRDAQFLFSSLSVAGGSDGTPAFTPPAALTPSGRTGDVSVQKGAVLATPVSADGNGGRVLLVGANVRNEGTISTPAGQTILAAGLQLAVAAHAGDDPSLRGLDVFVGAVGDYAGAVANTGLIESLTGSATMAGRAIEQLGAIESSTSVNLNGRIDLVASFGAVSNPSFDNSGQRGFGGPPFLFQQTGTVTLGAKSSTRILPDYAAMATIPGTSLPERSQINVEGGAVHFANSAVMFAPNGKVAIRAGEWPYQDLDGNRSTLNAAGAPETDLGNFIAAPAQRFLFSSGQVYLDPEALISVAGTPEVLVPLSQNILELQLRGGELADAPVQRTGPIRGLTLTVDIRRAGAYAGRFWMGTPLGDAVGAAGLIARNAAQLTARGGDITIQAGGSIVTRAKSTLDVSGGYFQYEAGMVQTTRLRLGGNLIDIANATPDRNYSGIYTGTFTRTTSKWGVTETFNQALAPTGAHFEQAYTGGAAGGNITLTAPGMALDGELRGLTVQGPRQRSAPAELSSLAVNFRAESFEPLLPVPFSTVWPTPPVVTFGTGNSQLEADPFKAPNGVAAALRPDRVAQVFLSPELYTESGFGHLALDNTDGRVVIPKGVSLAAPALGSLTISAAQVNIEGRIAAPGGTLAFTVHNISPAAIPLLPPSTSAPLPLASATRGIFTLSAGASLSTAGLTVDDRRSAVAPLLKPLVLDGGSIEINAFSAALAAGSAVDVSGGVAVSPRGRITYGDGGSIAILTGRDPVLSNLIGGSLALGTTFSGYSGATGGALSIRAQLIQVGEGAAPGGPAFLRFAGAAGQPETAQRIEPLVFAPDFFRTGGFTSYTLTGIGAAQSGTPGVGGETVFPPAVYLAPGTVLEPLAESWLAVPNTPGQRDIVLVRMLKPEGLRAPASLTFRGSGTDDPFTLERLETRGDIVLSAGVRIRTDAGASVTLAGATVAVFGSVEAPGGELTIAGDSDFPLTSQQASTATQALPTVYIGSAARLSAAGKAVLEADAYGRRLGTVHAGGSIAVEGNIVAEAGAVLDVSGTAQTLDLHPSQIGAGQATQVPLNSGLNSQPSSLRSVPVQVESNAGRIELSGSEMLFSDATLLGRAGGPTALGGTLAVFSGRFYAPDAALRTSADINLVVTQSGRTLPGGSAGRGIGRAVLDSTGAAVPAMGYFAADRFAAGGFEALDLGFQYFESASPLAFGGNVEFRGAVSIQARGALRLAGGGVIQADSRVALSGAYIATGQPFRAPQNPSDTFFPFTKTPALPTAEYRFAPTAGPGQLSLSAGLIDLGTLSLQNIGSALVAADGGDIRGNGTVNIAGELHLRAAQIYPTTLANFNLFAYDPAGGKGTVTISRAGQSGPPLSAGGNLAIYASTIRQGGVLLAPFGAITLGWDGTDIDPTDTDLDRPVDPVGGFRFDATTGTNTAIAPPVAGTVVLQAGSRTSVAGVDFSTGGGLLVPFGLSPDGLSWIDPRGVNITVSGLVQKTVSVNGTSVITESGSVVDLRGGGDLLAYRFVPGNGGSVDLLGTAGGEWAASATYQAGDLVTYEGQTWSARVRIDPDDFLEAQFPAEVPEPEVGAFWSRVAEAYAVVPGFASKFAPYAAFNTGGNAAQLGGDPGYVGGLGAGSQVRLDGGSGLSAGTYTLLPRRYATLPGAFLITPQTDLPLGRSSIPEGSTFTTGYRFDGFHQPTRASGLRAVFEVAPPEVLAGRVSYDLYTANAFLAEAATRLDIASVQRRPADAAALSFQGMSALQLAGTVLARADGGGRGAQVDVGTLADLFITDAGQGPSGSVVLSAAVLGGFGAESLLLGGRRYQTAGGPAVEVRTPNLTVDNAGTPLTGPEITLTATREMTLAAGAQVFATGARTEPSATLLVTGPGTLLRVSSDARAQIARTGLTASTLPRLTIGAGAQIGGAAVILDSTSGFDLSADASITTGAITFGAGQISLVLSGLPALTGQLVTPQLVLSGRVLDDVQQAGSVSLVSYQNTIDIHGPGTFGGTALSQLSLQAGEIRGFNQGAGSSVLTAGHITLSNRNNVAAPGPIAAASGALVFEAGAITKGSGTLTISQFADVVLNAGGGLVFDGTGELRAQQNLTANSPVLVTTQGATQTFAAGGALAVNATAGPVTVRGGLGGQLTLRGTSVLATSDILLPSGVLELRATTGDVRVGGLLDTGGIAQEFYDLTRYSDSGSIRLTADAGNVALLAGSAVSVAAETGGGDAGTVFISAAGGQFSADGAFAGQAGAGGDGGAFELDAASLASFDTLTDLLNDGGFTDSRNLRLRTGDITISGVSTVRNFILSADAGSITVTGTVDASGPTGGNIELLARNNVTVASGALLDVSGIGFSAAGKGGTVRLEAGTTSALGVANTAAFVTVAAGSTIDLGVDAYVPGLYTDPGSSAFFGQFTGKLHIRAPRVGTTVNVNALLGAILNPSAVVVEGFRVYAPTGGVLNATLRNTMNTDNIAFMVGEAGMRTNLLAGSVDPAGLATALVVAPGVEIINRNGDLILGTAGTANGTNPADDWNLADFRYGAEGSPGILTLRASGNLVLQNALSDGFAGFDAEQGTPPAGRQLWLANLLNIDPDRPVNVQSWSYRLVAGADFSAADFRRVRSLSSVAATSGSIQLGNFYTSTLPGVSGAAAETANAISPGTGTTTRYQVIRTGTGDIDLAAARDVQLRNQFATIYTAGVRITNPTQVFAPGDFAVPIVESVGGLHPDQTPLGEIQQNYPAQWALAGGDVRLAAQADIRRVTRIAGNVVTDASRQLPTNWLYRRGYVDPATGLFGVGGVDAGIATVTDPSASTTWWIDYSNFFQGIGALGGGDVRLVAGHDIINADAVIPTNARMPGLDGGQRIAPDADALVEYGGGNLVVQAGNNIDGGIYYVERGRGDLSAGHEITTNSARTPSLGLITATPQVRDPLTWLATTLFLGQGSFDVSARGDVLLGSVGNPFLLPQGVNNKYWNKTYFDTYGADSAVDVASFGGSVTHRLAVVLPGTSNARGALQAWIETQNFFSTSGAATRGSNTQPWIRLAETSVAPFATALSIAPPTLRSTAFSGDLEIVGSLNLFPSATGTLELAASGSVVGLNPAGRTTTGSPAQSVLAFTSARVNLSDADPAASPGIASPYGYQALVGRGANAVLTTQANFLSRVDTLFNETGSFTGSAAGIDRQQALHAATPVHLNDPNPVRIYGVGGDITGLTLFSAKAAQVAAANDVADVALYIQNVNPTDVSFVSAGRDVIPYNENTALRSQAANLAQGNIIIDSPRDTVLTTDAGTTVQTRVLAGDIQISGPGVLEVFAGRNFDLGTGPNLADGTGIGVSSIGNLRNPFLPFDGAGLIILAGVASPDGGPALGLAGSDLNFADFIKQYLPTGTVTGSPYFDSLGGAGADFSGLTPEQQAIVALEIFYAELRESGEAAAASGDYGTGLAAVEALFGSSLRPGEILTRARNLRTSTGGTISIVAPGGGLTMASDIFGNPLTPPGIVTEFGGTISIFTNGDVDIGQARIFTLRGGDLTIWSSTGDIAAGTAPKTVVTAPPTRVVIDATSATVQTDLGGLATGGGIGVLASVAGVEPGSVFLLAPQGTIDAGDAGIRATGNITIAAVQVLNADNISAAGTTAGVPSTPTVAAPSIGALTQPQTQPTGGDPGQQAAKEAQKRATEQQEELPSIITVEVLGYGGDEG